MVLNLYVDSAEDPFNVTDGVIWVPTGRASHVHEGGAADQACPRGVLVDPDGVDEVFLYLGGALLLVPEGVLDLHVPPGGDPLYIAEWVLDMLVECPL